MQRDMALIRLLLLQIEAEGSDVSRWIDDIVLDGYTEEQVSHHVWLLRDGGFIEAIDLSTLSGLKYRPRCLTWSGHEFLDAIRDRDTWETTLSLAKQVGTGSLEAIWAIAKSVVTKKIEKAIGLA